MVSNLFHQIKTFSRQLAEYFNLSDIFVCFSFESESEYLSLSVILFLLTFASLHRQGYTFCAVREGALLAVIFVLYTHVSPSLFNMPTLMRNHKESYLQGSAHRKELSRSVTREKRHLSTQLDLGLPRTGGCGTLSTPATRMKSIRCRCTLTYVEAH